MHQHNLYKTLNFSLKSSLVFGTPEIGSWCETFKLPNLYRHANNDGIRQARTHPFTLAAFPVQFTYFPLALAYATKTNSKPILFNG